MRHDTKSNDRSENIKANMKTVNKYVYGVKMVHLFVPTDLNGLTPLVLYELLNLFLI